MAGTLPIDGLTVALVLPKGHKIIGSTIGGYAGAAQDDIYYPVQIDDRAYYVEYVEPENFVLRLGIGPFSHDFPVDLTDGRDVSNPYCSGVFVRNITMDELKRAFGPDAFTE